MENVTNVQALRISSTFVYTNHLPIKQLLRQEAYVDTYSPIPKLTRSWSILNEASYIKYGGNATTTKRSMLIATKCNYEVWHERPTKTWYTIYLLLVLHSWKNVMRLMKSRTIGLHIKVSIRLVIAKLNRR